jgi:UDP-3-O-[3-hydroxymyristoyl] glucosamine N-acyltransferase
MTAADIAALVGGEVVGSPDTCVSGVAALDEADRGDLSLLASASYLPYFHASSAGVVLVAPEFRDAATGPATYIVVRDPRLAIARVLDVLLPSESPSWGIHASAQLGQRCRWSGRLSLAAGAVLGAGVRLGRDCVVGPGAIIGAGATCGDECRIGAAATIAPGVVLGDRVVVKPGARIGTPGFAWVGQGTRRAVRHVGACRVGNDVEIGANSTVDRGSVGSTVIGAGTKIDNLVHVAHNVRIGSGCVIMAQVGIAGTTTIEDDVIIAGQAGLAGQLRVGRAAKLAAQSGIIGDIAPGTTVSGYPARDHRSVLRQAAALARLTPLVNTLERLAEDHADRD